MTIKKVHEPLIALLEANKNKKVSSIIEEIKALCSAKVNSKTFIADEDGNIIAIFCYYHKQWELVADVPYGLKASSTTGLNVMCKLGTSLWTKQNKAVKDVNTVVLNKLEKGELKPEDIADFKAKLVDEAKVMNETDMPEGYATAEEALEASK